MLSSQQIRTATALGALVLLLTAFQNCGVESGLGGSKMKANNQTKGNGEGYGGKVTRFGHGVCNGEGEASILEQRGSDFYLIREACKDIEPAKLGNNEVDYQAHAATIALYDSRVYKVIVPEGQGPAKEPCNSCGTGQSGGAPQQRTLVFQRLCRATTAAAFPHQVVDITIDLDTNYFSKSYIALVNYAAAGAVVGEKSEFWVDSSAVLVGNAASPGQIMTGTGLPAGESYKVQMGSAGQYAIANFVLKANYPVASTASGLTLNCYDF